jgi:hypothetical protein
MRNGELGPEAWRVLPAWMPYLMLSAVDPPDARHPGPVVGPGSRVRPCATSGATVCLEVDGGEGEIGRGYTTLPVFPRDRAWRRRCARLAAVAGLAAAIAGATVVLG